MPIGYPGPGSKPKIDAEPWWKKKIQEARKTKVKRSPYRVRDYQRVSRNRTTRKVGEGKRGRIGGYAAAYRARPKPAAGYDQYRPGYRAGKGVKFDFGKYERASEEYAATQEQPAYYPTGPRFGPRTATYKGLPSGLSRDPLAGLPDIYQYTVEQMKLWQEYLASLRAGQADSAGGYSPGYGQSYGGRRYGGGGGGGGSTYEPQPDDYYKNLVTWRI